MYAIVLVLHVLVSVLLVLIVLLQQPQKGGMSTVFGGGESIFGGGGAAPFLTKLTTGLAIGFVITSMTLVLLSINRPAAPGRTRPAQTAPARPGEQPAPAAPAEGGE